MGASSPLVVTKTLRALALAATADGEIVICKAPFAGTISAVAYLPMAAIIGANTDSRTASIVNAGNAGTGTTEVAALAFTSGVNAAKHASKAIPLSATADNLKVTAGQSIVWKSTHVGSSGLADPGGLVEITFTRDE